MPGADCHAGAVPVAHANGDAYTNGDTDGFTHTYSYGNTNLHTDALRHRDYPKRWIRDRQLPTLGHS